METYVIHADSKINVISFCVNKSRNEFVITVIDRAKAFNQLEVNNPEVGNDPKTQKVGDLGIMIVKKIMTEYAYVRINDKYILVLRKSFTKDDKN